MKTINITIEGKEYKMKVGFGVMMEYEEKFNKPITSISKTTEIIHLLYTTLKYNNEDFNYEFKQFVDDVMDKQPDLIHSLTSLLFGEKSEDIEEKK